MIKNVKLVELNKYCDYFLKYTNFEDDLMEYKCLVCDKNCQTKFNEKVKERFFNTYKFSNHGNNKFIYFIITKRCLSLRIYG